MKNLFFLKEFAIITVGDIIVAAAVFFFMLPSHVSVGSGAALAMVLSNFGTTISIDNRTDNQRDPADHRIPSDWP